MRLTTNNGWPVPEGDDPPDVPYWMGQLADAQDATFDVIPWTNLPIVGTFTPMAGLELPQYRRDGKVVTLRGGVLNTTMAASGSYFIVAAGGLPASCRPLMPSLGGGGSSVGGAALPGVHVLQDGSVQLRLGTVLGAYYKIDRVTFRTD